MSRFKKYYENQGKKRKNARTSPESKPIFKEPLPVVEILAKMVDDGRITEECASEALCVNDPVSFQEFCFKWNILPALN